jgi:hypothetical protein
MASSENQEILFLRPVLASLSFFASFSSTLLCWRYFQFVPSLFFSCRRSCLKVMERLTKKVFRIQSRFISAIFLVDSARANRKARPARRCSAYKKTHEQGGGGGGGVSFITKQLCAEFAGICFERR